MNDFIINDNVRMEKRKKSIYVGLDVMKFFCALLIVFTHTYNHDWGVFGEWIYSNLTPMGVPFFFIVSGFLYTSKLQSTGEEKKEYCSRYLNRVVCMYIFWSVITLPVAWMNINVAHGDYSFLMKLLYIVRCFFLTGSIGIYWYILALVYNSVIIFYMMKWNKMKVLYIVSFMFFIMGVLYDGGMLKDTFLGNAIHIVIGSERNFLNVGLFYMCIGACLVKFRNTLNLYFLCSLFITSLLISSYMHVVSSYRIMQAPLAILLFMLAMRLKLGLSTGASLMMRQWSTALYLGHFPFILCFDYYLKRGSMIDLPISILFSLVLFYVIKIISPNRLAIIAYG